MSRVTADHSSTWVHYTGEPIGPVGANRSDGHRVKLFEESVTFIAQLHPEDQDGMVPPLDRTWMIGIWPVDVYQIPIIIGISSGVLLLLLFIAVLVAWRCCHFQRLREKAFAINAEGRTPVIHSPSTGSYPSVLAMSMSPSKPASPSLTAARNQLASNSCELVRLTTETPTTTMSTLTTANNAVEGEDSQHQTTIERHSCEDMSLVGCGNYIAFDIPSFYEESLNSSSLSTSSNAVLDGSWSNCDGSLNELKTRSLPSWARNKPPIRSAQQHNSRHANADQKDGRCAVPIIGSKRSHHGLRHDAAAIMAINKTAKTTAVRDNGDNLSGRVSLVGHNDAVIVFNERTAL
ncbi:uncharacterized protein LOC124188550 isoform X3 [Daphnia pulex]|uniref:uncharacterized protein LOC124188550 isoform X3 n=1 Tax=Daphnia pulex TaxID=6669 RepID=UPI001EDEF0D9|nr:uncharacterized protein LOC124188550 isoform X3 [Daphnia pulex]